MHLSETGIVQQFDKDGKKDEFLLGMIEWLTNASDSELDILCAELLDGFAASED